MSLANKPEQGPLSLKKEGNALGKSNPNMRFDVGHKLLENHFDGIVVDPITDAWLDVLKQ